MFHIGNGKASGESSSDKSQLGYPSLNLDSNRTMKPILIGVCDPQHCKRLQLFLSVSFQPLLKSHGKGMGQRVVMISNDNLIMLNDGCKHS